MPLMLLKHLLNAIPCLAGGGVSTAILLESLSYKDWQCHEVYFLLSESTAASTTPNMLLTSGLLKITKVFKAMLCEKKFNLVGLLKVTKVFKVMLCEKIFKIIMCSSHLVNSII